MLDMKCRSMSDNLVFLNFREHEDEDTENVLKSFLRNRLDITDTCYEKVHQFGSKIQRPVLGQTVGPQIVVAKFTYFKDRERKGTHYGIMNGSQRR